MSALLGHRRGREGAKKSCECTAGAEEAVSRQQLRGRAVGARCKGREAARTCLSQGLANGVAEVMAEAKILRSGRTAKVTIMMMSRQTII